MRIGTVNLSDSMRAVLHQVCNAAISGECGPVSFSETVKLNYTRGSTCATLSFDGKVEADGPGGLDPDIKSVEIHDDHIRIYFALNSWLEIR